VAAAIVTPSARPDRPRLAVLTPVLNEEANLPRYVDAVRSHVLDRADLDAYVVFVDDGSSDSSWAMIRSISAADPRFQGIRLSRNFGSHTATWAAMVNVEPDTDAAVVLACDLQDPVRTIAEFVDCWRLGADIVWGVRRKREDPGWRILTSRGFEALLRRYAMPRGSRFSTGGFLLMDRRVIAAVSQMREHNRVNFALVAWTGFEQHRVEYDRAERIAGQSGWTFRAMLKSLYDAFVGFSSLPIRLMTTAAISAFIVAMSLSGFLVISFLIKKPIPGWTSQMLITSLFFGIQFSLTAIMGEYLYRIYAEVLRRPSYFISDATRADGLRAAPASRASDDLFGE
jgi:glycosyltransferase involved in cell wall biosynthesis